MVSLSSPIFSPSAAADSDSQANERGYDTQGVVIGDLADFDVSEGREYLLFDDQPAKNTPSGASKGMLLVRADGSTHGLQMGVTGSSPWGSWIQAQDNNISAPYPLTLQPGGGNVGIGKTTATTTLEVEGDISGLSLIHI